MIKVKRPAGGQTIIEYTVLIAIIAGAFLLTGIYLKRGIQGRWKETVDQLGEQYDPTAMNTDIRFSVNTNAFSTVTLIKEPGGFWTNKADIINSAETKSGSSAVSGY